jgi:hypothetical protein
MLPKQYRYCSVCRQNHQQGNGHKYSTKHKQRLTQLLSKAHKRIQEIRVFLLNNNNVSSRLQPPQEDHQQQRKFWCHFCEQEVVEEKQISFMWGDVIQHLASAEHVAAVKAFWSEHGADVAKRHLYVISEEDLEKWKEACEVPIAAAAAAAGEVRNNGKERVETNNLEASRIMAQRVVEISVRLQYMSISHGPQCWVLNRFQMMGSCNLFFLKAI